VFIRVHPWLQGFGFRNSGFSRISDFGLRVSFCLALAFAGCKKDIANEAIETDANGYLCLKCGAKLYTERSVFIGPKCPKCGEDRLMPVVGYYCEKDKHLTIRAGRGDRQG